VKQVVAAMPPPSHTELFGLKLVVSGTHPECSGYGWTDIYFYMPLDMVYMYCLCINSNTYKTDAE